MGFGRVLDSSAMRVPFAAGQDDALH